MNCWSEFFRVGWLILADFRYGVELVLYFVFHLAIAYCLLSYLKVLFLFWFRIFVLWFDGFSLVGWCYWNGFGWFFLKIKCLIAFCFQLFVRYFLFTLLIILLIRSFHYLFQALIHLWFFRTFLTVALLLFRLLRLLFLIVFVR